MLGVGPKIFSPNLFSLSATHSTELHYSLQHPFSLLFLYLLSTKKRILNLLFIHFRAQT